MIIAAVCNTDMIIAAGMCDIALLYSMHIATGRCD